MSAHTKGNWYVGEKHPTCEVRYVCIGNGEEWQTELAVLYHSQGAEQEANARLMAAAPDLLLDLYAACNYIEALGGDAKKYRQTIAKAEGA